MCFYKGEGVFGGKRWSDVFVFGHETPNWMVKEYSTSPPPLYRHITQTINLQGVALYIASTAYK